LGEVAEDVEGAQVGVVLFAGGDGDGCHRVNYSAVWGMGKGWGWLWGCWGSIGRALGEGKGSLIIRLGVDRGWTKDGRRMGEGWAKDGYRVDRGKSGGCHAALATTGGGGIRY
jgi:hypothetical protein